MKRHFLILAAAALVLAGCHGTKGSSEASSSDEDATEEIADSTSDDALAAAEQPAYDDCFTHERLRIDIVLAGDSKEQKAYVDGLRRECEWAGPEATIDPCGYGQYRYQAFMDGKLVFSRGFSTLFEEWRTTAQAAEIPMAQSQSLWMPFPKQKTHIVLSQRVRRSGKFRKMLEFDVDPEDRHIVPGPENDFRVVPLQIAGDLRDKVDLLFVAEGYKSSEMAKFRKDAERMMDYMFTMEPYASRKDDFNVWVVESASKDSGVDVPQDGVWRSTAMDSSFDTFYEDRYLTITDHKKIASAVSGVPFDALFIIANDSKYGGGGIYNSYAMGTSDHFFSLPVFIHEFGHSFAGLADEYYDSSVSYEDYYPEGVEPWEPNITTMTDFKSKWKDMVDSETPVPTPNDSTWAGTVGVFEGAGYQAKGCYRPYYECRMLNNTAPGFCPVCQRAISRMIDYYTGKTNE